MPPLPHYMISDATMAGLSFGNTATSGIDGGYAPLVDVDGKIAVTQAVQKKVVDSSLRNLVPRSVGDEGAESVGYTHKGGTALSSMDVHQIGLHSAGGEGKRYPKCVVASLG